MNAQYPWMQPRIAAPSSATSMLKSNIPGFENMSGAAGGNIMQLLGGMPSASPARRANAYFGASSGMPGSDFVRNRGYDLYGEQAEGYKQRGLDNFLKLLQGYSGTVAPTAGQEIQNNQFGADLDFRQRQADIDNALNREKLNIAKPKPLENSYSEYDTLGNRTKYIPGRPTYR